MYSRAAGEPESGGGLGVEKEGLRRGNDEKEARRLEGELEDK